jgi:hypothetical protein
MRKVDARIYFIFLTLSRYLNYQAEEGTLTVTHLMAVTKYLYTHIGLIDKDARGHINKFLPIINHEKNIIVRKKDSII